MAHETGAFKKYGLDVQLIYIASSGMNIQALLGGSLDVSAPGISGVVLAAARGAPVLTIAAMTNRPAMTLYVQPDITRAGSPPPPPLTAKVIDNSVVDKLVKDGFIEKVFAKAAR